MTNPDNENLEALESDEYKAFMDIVKGLTAHQTALALNSLTPGIDWRNCSKGFMASKWSCRTKVWEFSIAKMPTPDCLARAVKVVQAQYEHKLNPL